TRNAGLFQRDALVAEHVLERIPWPLHGSTPESTARARAEIAAVRYDVALIATEEPEGFALAAPIPTRVGFTTGWARPLKSLWVRARTTRIVDRSQHLGGDAAHEVEVLYRLGVGLVTEPAPPRETARLRALLAGEARRREDYIVLQAGPKWRATGVLDAVLAEIVARLDPYAVRVVCAPGEAQDVRRTLGVDGETFDDLARWVALLDAARLVVTVDSGAAHVAGMLGTPVVDVFPDEHFGPQVERWRPWAAPYRALRASQTNGGGGRALVEAVLDGF
ncbi:MAG TPA: glycosyltransferase family 9 protein, partial [Candidatus Acidoferrum sp.]|nr:glycosyltransferase family 9 protein [Candidatus Acidoferrum sp.]